MWRSSGMKITMTVLALFVAAGAVVVAAVYWQTSRLLTERTFESLLGETQNLSEIAARSGQQGLVAALAARERRSGGFRYALADENGRTIWIGALRAWPDELREDNATARFRYSSGSAAGGGAPPDEAHAVGATLRLPEGGRLLVARDVTEQVLLTATMRWWFLVGLGALISMALLSGWAINRLLQARLAAITATADRIMAGDLTQRIPVAQEQAADGSDGGDEFDAVARRLNLMLARIEMLMHGMREVSDNIAHDLKTPLNRMRMKVEESLRSNSGDEDVYRRGLERVLDETDDLMRTFNALLRVARLEAGAAGDNVETFDVAEMVRDLGEFYEPVVEEAGIALVVKAPAPVYLDGERQLISQALTNLIENALKYGVEEEAVRGGKNRENDIVIGASLDEGEAYLWVEDRGAGIAKADRGRVLDRFVRLDRARSKPGTGLGLSLVAAVVRRHGGTVLLEDNAPGLRVVLRLPRARVGPTSGAAGRGRVCRAGTVNRSGDAAAQPAEFHTMADA